LYWRSVKKAFLIPQANVTAKAKAIYDSINWLGNDYARILAIFKTLSYKTQVSFLADKFAQMYKTDLLDYLKNGKSNFLVQNALNDTQVQTIIDFVNKLK
jgi:hypothetical protein